MSNIKITIEGVEKEFEPIEEGYMKVYDPNINFLFQKKWYREVEPVKQDYEIMSFKNGKGDIFEKTDKGNFTTYNSENTYSLDRMIEGIQVYATFIHSVKRLTDGEVFTVGDDERHINGKIAKIIISDKNEVWLCNVYNLRIFLRDAVKVKQPSILLTTEDGVSIMDKNIRIFVVNKNLAHSYYIRAEKCINDLKCLYFSTYAAGEEYILKNKPKPIVLLTTEDSVEITDGKELIHWIDEKFYKYNSKAKDLANVSYCKYFSTEAARDEYILQNKPVTVTLAEMLKSYYNGCYNESTTRAEDLTNFFKSKQK